MVAKRECSGRMAMGTPASNDSRGIQRRPRCLTIVFALVTCWLLAKNFEISASSAIPAGVFETDASPRPNEYSPSCQNICNHRNNKIVILADSIYIAGLNDRMSTLLFYANLAYHLCATVFFPPPRVVLSNQHNDWNKVSGDLVWSDFFELKFRDDYSSSKPVRQFSGSMSKFSSSRYTYNKWYRITAIGENFGKLPTIEGHDTDAATQFERLQDFVRIQQQQQQGEGGNGFADFNANTTFYTFPLNASKNFEGFIWVFDMWVWNVADQLQPSIERLNNKASNRHANPSHSNFTDETLPQLLTPGRQACVHGMDKAYLERSSVLNNLTDQVFDRIHTKVPHNQSLGFFHVRRNDAMRECNSTLERIREYLSCSLNSTVVDHLGKSTLLFASDERNTTYRQGVKGVVESLGHGFVDLDGLVWDVVRGYAGNTSKYVNNFVVFEVANAVKGNSRVGFILELRRMKCPNCTDVTIKWW